jgi:hypothetical protein
VDTACSMIRPLLVAPQFSVPGDPSRPWKTLVSLGLDPSQRLETRTR